MAVADELVMLREKVARLEAERALLMDVFVYEQKDGRWNSMVTDKPASFATQEAAEVATLRALAESIAETAPKPSG